eukprot:g3078.t1
MPLVEDVDSFGNEVCSKGNQVGLAPKVNKDVAEVEKMDVCNKEREEMTIVNEQKEREEMTIGNEQKEEEQEDSYGTSVDKSEKNKYLLACGNSLAGQLGVGKYTNAVHFQNTVGFLADAKVISVCSSQQHSVALTSSGSVLTAGENTQHQLGRDSKACYIFRRVASLEMWNVKCVAAGNGFTAILTSNSLVFTWGNNTSGELGLGDREPRTRPRPIKSLNRTKASITKIAAGHHHCLAVSSAGEVYTWGSSRSGQCGTGQYSSESTPFRLDTISTDACLDVKAGAEHSIALTASGELIVFGGNRTGALGTGDKKHRLRPVKLQALRNVTIATLSTGAHHTVAVGTNGLVYSFGANNSGQLGVGDRTIRTLPSVVEKLRDLKFEQGVAWSSVVCGSQHSLVLGYDKAGEVVLYGWGSNMNGQLAIKKCTQKILRPVKLEIKNDSLQVETIFAGGNQTFFTFAKNGDRKRNKSPQKVANSLVLSLKTIRNMIQDLRQKTITLQVFRQNLYTSFSSARLLASAFKLQKETGCGGDGDLNNTNSSMEYQLKRAQLSGIHLNVINVRTALNELAEVAKGQEIIKTTLMRALMHLTESLKKLSSSGQFPLSILIILLQMPHLQEEPKKNSLVLTNLMALIMSLRPNEKKKIFIWLASENSISFRSIVRMVREHLDENCYNDKYHYKDMWPSAKFLKQLFAIHIKSSLVLRREDGLTYPSIHASEFYAPGISKSVELQQEIERWKNQKNAFSICDYPFLLTPVAKARLLRVEMVSSCLGSISRTSPWLRTFLSLASGNLSLRLPASTPKLVVKVRRSHVKLDTLNVLYPIIRQKPFLLRRPLHVVFVGEEGVDEGGLSKDFFGLISEDIFSIQNRSAVFTSTQKNQLWFSASEGPDGIIVRDAVVGEMKEQSFSKGERVEARWGGAEGHWYPGVIQQVNNPSPSIYTFDVQFDDGDFGKSLPLPFVRQLPDDNMNFGSHEEEAQYVSLELTGVILGLAIFNGVLLNAPFASPFWRALLDLPLRFQDVEEVDPQLYASLKGLLEMEEKNIESLGLTFEISERRKDGTVRNILLLKNGDEIAVTSENRKLFVQLYTKWILVDRVSHLFDPLKRGVQKMLGGHILSLFRPDELSLIVQGVPKTQNLYILKDKARYVAWENDTMEVIDFFWDVVKHLNDDLQKQLLRFITGSQRVPIEGLGSVVIVVQKSNMNINCLPVAHTCTQTIELPCYPTKEILKEKLLLSLRWENEGFGLA